MAYGTWSVSHSARRVSEACAVWPEARDLCVRGAYRGACHSARIATPQHQAPSLPRPDSAPWAAWRSDGVVGVRRSGGAADGPRCENGCARGAAPVAWCVAPGERRPAKGKTRNMHGARCGATTHHRMTLIMTVQYSVLSLQYSSMYM